MKPITFEPVAIGALALSILLTVYGQLIMKSQLNAAGAIPTELQDRVVWMLNFLFRPWVISSFAAAFVAAMGWIMVLNRFPLSWAYPFISLTFPLVVLASAFMFGEALSWQRIAGVTLIVLGVALQAQG